MSDQAITKIEVNAGLGATVLGLLKKPSVIWVIALAGWFFAGSQFWNRHERVKTMLVKADKEARQKNVRKNRVITDRQVGNLRNARHRKTKRAEKTKRADTVMDRYEGKTKAVVPQDIHGAIHEVE